MEFICDGLVAHSGWTDDFHCLAARKPRISIGPIRLMAWGRVCILACFHINWTKFWLMHTTLHFRLLQPLVFGVYIQVLCYLPVHEAGWLNFILDISLLMSDRIYTVQRWYLILSFACFVYMHYHRTNFNSYLLHFLHRFSLFILTLWHFDFRLIAFF